jgi:hypothetical protein
MIADYPLSPFCCVIVALTSANAHISALEAELKAAREAWESANAVKVSAEKVAKSAETKAKKAEKALADADQKRVQREQSIAEHLDKIFVAIGSKYHVIPFGYSGLYLLIFVCFLCLFLCGAAEKIGESWKLWQPNTEDPLLAVVDLLESN